MSTISSNIQHPHFIDMKWNDIKSRYFIEKVEECD